MSATQVRGQQILAGSLTDADVAAANKDGIATLASLRTLGTGAQQACAGNDSRLLSALDQNQRMYRSLLSTSGTLLLVSGTAYFVYLGRVTSQFTPKFVGVYVTTAGAGTQTAEIGLFSTPNAPDRASQSLTKIVSTGTLASLLSASIVRNSTAFSTTVSAGTHLWAGIRTALQPTQPTCMALIGDMGQGQVLTAASASALTGAGPWTGAIPSLVTTGVAPDLRVTLD